MKVIKNNNSKTIVCPHCHSVLEITRDDIQGQDYKSRLSAGGGICPITVPCGACHKSVSLGYSDQDVFDE